MNKTVRFWAYDSDEVVLGRPVGSDWVSRGATVTLGRFDGFNIAV